MGLNSSSAARSKDTDHEPSADELFKLEMEVEEAHNPLSLKDQAQARIKFTLNQKMDMAGLLHGSQMYEDS